MLRRPTTFADPDTVSKMPSSHQKRREVQNREDSERQRILMLTHRFPFPPNRGDRIRSYNLLRVLASRYEVTLGCTTDEPIATANCAIIQSLCEDLFIAPLSRPRRLANACGSFFSKRSVTESMFCAPSLLDSVTSWQQEKPFHAVVVFCSSMFQYVDTIHFDATPIIVDLVDVDSEKWRQMSEESSFPMSGVYKRESNFVRFLEQRIAERAQTVTLVSDAEADLFRRVVDSTRPVYGVSNGVDTDFFRPDSGDAAAEAKASSIRLVFTGVLDYRPNVEGIVWFCHNVLPILRADLKVQLQIVGRSPSKRVAELEKIPEVSVIGEVPDVRPYLQDADIAISPLKLARGIQNKVLEAMATALPVVLTAESAEGINAISGEDFLIANTAQEWREALLRLGGNSDLRGSMGLAARTLTVERFSWPARLSQFLRIIDDASSVPAVRAIQPEARDP